MSPGAHVGLLIAGITLSGVTARVQAPPVQKQYAIAQAPAELRPAIQRGDQVIATLQRALVSELDRALDRGGLAEAINVCHLEAAAVAHEVGRAQGVAAGRTSDRLRNPINAPRPWSVPLVTQFAGHRAAGIDGYAVDLGDRVGVMRPIPLRSVCAGCHGPESRLSPAVRQELKERYPVDRAIGFRDGDLRGWFWVEVPKEAGASR